MFVRSVFLGVAAALIVGGAQAADLLIPTTPQPIYEAAGFSWNGLYAGFHGGAQFDELLTVGVIGAHAGVNFIVAEPILLGLEGTAEYVWSNDVSAGEFFVNARVGAVVADAVLVYGLAGAGVKTAEGADNVGIYQLGGGVELAVTEAVSVRAQLVGLNDFDDTNKQLFEAAKAAVGVSYHF